MNDATKQLTEVDALIDVYEKTVMKLEENFDANMNKFGITQQFIECLITTDDDDIEKMDLADIRMWLTQNNCDPNCIQDYYYKLPDTEKLSRFSEFAIKFLSELRADYLDLLKAKEDVKRLHENRADITKSFYDTIRSPKYREARLAHLDALRERIKDEEDEIKAAVMKRKLDCIEKSQMLTFLNERLVKYGKKEMRSILDCFFDTKRGDYTLKLYYDKLKRLNLNKFTHQGFFNLEEKLLSEKYEAFNNFFLFHVIRWVSHIDTNDDADNLYFSSLIGTLRDVVSGECTEDEKKLLIKTMKDFYDFIDMDMYDPIFREKNTNYKHHPIRIAFEKEEAVKKAQAIENEIKRELGKLYTKDIKPDDIEKFYHELIDEKHVLREFVFEYSKKYRDMYTESVRKGFLYHTVWGMYEKTVNEIIKSGEEDYEFPLMKSKLINKEVEIYARKQEEPSEPEISGNVDDAGGED